MIVQIVEVNCDAHGPESIMGSGSMRRGGYTFTFWSVNLSSVSPEISIQSSPESFSTANLTQCSSHFLQCCGAEGGYSQGSSEDLKSLSKYPFKTLAALTVQFWTFASIFVPKSVLRLSSNLARSSFVITRWLA